MNLLKNLRNKLSKSSYIETKDSAIAGFFVYTKAYTRVITKKKLSENAGLI